VVLGAALVVLGLWRLAVRSSSRARSHDELGNELVGRLTEEVRKWRAEANHWRRTAERLQHELDRREE
jgi:hypothetical protein